MGGGSNPYSQIVGGISGGVGGLLQNQKEGSRDAGNAYTFLNPDGSVNKLADQNRTSALQNIANQGAQSNMTAEDPTKQVQNNPMLSGLYGKGGTLDRTGAEEQNLATSGYELTPGDRTAYGQASGDITRMFGQNEQGLSQSLSDRGLSSSGVAGQQFSGLLGNKNEQLAGLQTQIAQNRMKMNMQRLGQTRQFLSQLGGQGEQAIQGQFGRNLETDQNMRARGRSAMDFLGAQQGQSNETLAQQQQTEHGGAAYNHFAGNLAGMAAAGGSKGGGGGGGGMGG